MLPLLKLTTTSACQHRTHFSDHFVDQNKSRNDHVATYTRFCSPRTNKTCVASIEQILPSNWCDPRRSSFLRGDPDDGDAVTLENDASSVPNDDGVQRPQKRCSGTVLNDNDIG